MPRPKALSWFLGIFAALAIFGGVVGLLVFFAYQFRLPLPDLAADEPEIAEGTPAETATAPATLRADLPMPLEMNIASRHIADQGYIVQFHNGSDQLLHAVFHTESAADHTTRTDPIDIPAKSTIELGWDRGWKLGPGDRVIVTSDGFKPITWIMPQ